MDAKLADLEKRVAALEERLAPRSMTLRLDATGFAEIMARAVDQAIHDAVRKSPRDEYSCPIKPKQEVVITIDGKRLATYLV